jgi:hypothetical protein
VTSMDMHARPRLGARECKSVWRRLALSMHLKGIVSRFSRKKMLQAFPHTQVGRNVHSRLHHDPSHLSNDLRNNLRVPPMKPIFGIARYCTPET